MKPVKYALLTLLLLCASAAHAFDTGRASFSVRVNDQVVPYRVFAVFAMPGDELAIEAVGDGAPRAAIRTPGDAPRGNAGRWNWSAPSRPGVYPLDIENNGDAIRLNVVVLHPMGSVADGRLNGYRIGRYPARPLNGNRAYEAPVGFIELNAETESLQLSPHFRLSQFPSKQASNGAPKYLVLQERLLLKLELLLEDINARGFAADTLTIMSGYRTPHYNAAIGNVQYSRHVYGGAADIYPDVAPADGVMDDLDGDGRSTHADAQLLYRWANELFRKPENSHLAGGLGVYRSNSAHGPFLHMDARGQRARWGLIP